MVDWAKKIRKAVGGDIEADEQVEAGVFVQPAGTTRGMMGSQLGGVVGAVIADKLGGAKDEPVELSRETGVAADIPDKRLVLGLTSRRLLVWGHSTMSGKPKGLEAAIPLDRVLAVEAEKGKLAHRLVVAFDDGSGIQVEAPKVGKPDDFVAAFARLTGR